MFASRPHGFDPPAPVRRAALTHAQRHALVVLFFAGEMNRARGFFTAKDSAPIMGSTIDCLHRKGMVRLGVEHRKRPNFGKIIEYRYYVTLTKRGEWYATTLIQQRGALVEALSPELAPDNFEDAANVYPAEAEAEPSL